MRPEEIVAYIGAAAWLPQIIYWIYRWSLKTKMRIVPAQLGEIGFTSYGPIFNVRMAFFADNRDLIVHGFSLSVRHQEGETRVFHWAGLGEKFSELIDASGNKQTLSRDQSPIAIKVGTQSLLDNMVRFQEPEYHKADRAVVMTLVEHCNFVKKKNQNNFVQDILESKEFLKVIETRQRWFWWKPGRYTVTLNPTSFQKFELLGATFQFELQDVDVESLKKNIPYIETDICNMIQANLPDYQAEPINWQWVNVTLFREGI